MKMYKLEDQTPYLYRTTYYGKSWQLITSGLNKEVTTRAIREDSKVPGLLYAGTERGVIVSYDNGESYDVRHDNNKVYQTDNFDEAMQMAEVIAFNNYAATWSE